MKKIAFIVDSSSGIKNGEIKDVYVVPGCVNVNENGKISSYRDQLEIDHEQLCKLLNEGKDISTSQPAAGDIMKTLEDIQGKYDKVFALPIPVKLSSSLNTWKMLEEDYPKLKAINNYSLVGVTRWYINHFLAVAKKHELTEKEISEYMEQTKNKWAGYLVVPNLNQLIKGGRMSGFKGFLAKMLSLKIVISFDYNGLVFLDKSSKYEGCLEIIKNDLEKRIEYSKHKPILKLTYESCTNEKYNIKQFTSLTKKQFNIEESVQPEHISSIIVAHTGPDYGVFLTMVD